MKTWSEFFRQSEEDSIKKRLVEMPMRIGNWDKQSQKSWSQKNLDSLWDIASQEIQTNVGKIAGEDLIKVGHNTIRYYFLIKDDTPTFVVSLTSRKDIFLPKAWQVDIAARTNSKAKLEDIYKHLINKEGVHIITGVEHTGGAEKIWKKILSKSSTKYDIINDSTGEVLDIDLEDAWGNKDKHLNISIVIRKM